MTNRKKADKGTGNLTKPDIASPARSAKKGTLAERKAILDGIGGSEKLSKNQTGPVWDGPGAKQRSPIMNGKATIEVPNQSGKSREDLLAELTLSTIGRNSLSAQGFANRGMGNSAEIVPSMKVFADLCDNVRSGNLDDLTDMLAAQALTLDAMFTEYARMAVINLGSFPDAVQRYTALATKAQTNCRVTVETLAKVKRGGKQSIQITHVHKGGQAVVAETVNNGTGGKEGPSAENIKQAHEQAADAAVAALSGADPARDGVPLPSHEGEEALPAAWREIDGGAQGQP